jgi:hypothetical protein
MRAHFQEVIPAMRAAAAWKPPANWADARAVVMLQLMAKRLLRHFQDKESRPRDSTVCLGRKIGALDCRCHDDL